MASASAHSNGWVYLVTANQYDDRGRLLVKIGLTGRDVQKRNKEHQTGSPGVIETIYQFWTDDMGREEKLLHDLYESKRVRANGEWFALTQDDINTIMSMYPNGFEGEGYTSFAELAEAMLSALKYLLMYPLLIAWDYLKGKFDVLS